MTLEFGLGSRMFGSFIAIKVVEFFINSSFSLPYTIILSLVVAWSVGYFTTSNEINEALPVIGIVSSPINPRSQIIEDEMIQGNFSEFRISSNEVNVYRR